MKESSPQLYSLSQTHLHLSHSPFTGPPVMSRGCEKRKVEWDGRGREPGLAARNQAMMKPGGSGINKGVK